jgi:hypothetical protein
MAAGQPLAVMTANGVYGEPNPPDSGGWISDSASGMANGQTLEIELGGWALVVTKTTTTAWTFSLRNTTASARDYYLVAGRQATTVITPYRGRDTLAAGATQLFYQSTASATGYTLDASVRDLGTGRLVRFQADTTGAITGNTAAATVYARED